MTLIRADLDSARSLAMRLSRLARSTRDRKLEVEAHWAAGVTLVNRGEFTAALKHLGRALERYHPSQRQTHLVVYGHDPAVACRCFSAWARWFRGDGDGALAEAYKALELAQALQHPETRCYALFFSAWVHQLREEALECRQQAHTLVEYARQHGLAQWIAFGSILRGWASARLRNDDGVDEIQSALEAYRSIGAEISRPHFLALLAEAVAARGRAREALELLDESLNLAERTGGRYYEAELHRLKGETLLKSGLTSEAGNHLRLALDVARRQRARTCALRARQSLAHLRALDTQTSRSSRSSSSGASGRAPGITRR